MVLNHSRFGLSAGTNNTVQNVLGLLEGKIAIVLGMEGQRHLEVVYHGCFLVF